MKSFFQNEQMDSLIRFFNNSKGMAETRCSDSMILNWLNSQNLFNFCSYEQNIFWIQLLKQITERIRPIICYW